MGGVKFALYRAHKLGVSRNGNCINLPYILFRILYTVASQLTCCFFCCFLGVAVAVVAVVVAIVVVFVQLLCKWHENDNCCNYNIKLGDHGSQGFLFLFDSLFAIAFALPRHPASGLTFLYMVLYFFAVIARVGFGSTSFYSLPLPLPLHLSRLLTRSPEHSRSDCCVFCRICLLIRILALKLNCSSSRTTPLAGKKKIYIF